MANEISKVVEIIPQADLAAIIMLDDASRAAHRQLMEADEAGNQITKALIMARAMKRLKELLSDRIMGDIMELKGSSAGFKTDEVGRKGGNYTIAEVRSVVILALIRGLRVTGNEFTIIACGLYCNKEGYERLLREFVGLTNLKIRIGVPQTMGEKGALIACEAEWYFHGIPDSIACEKEATSDYRIPVKVDAYTSIDAMAGKAKSKLLRRVYERITGSELLSEADGEDDATSEYDLAQQEAARQRAERLASESREANTAESEGMKR